MQNYHLIQKQISKLEIQRDALYQKELASVIETIQAQMAEYGISTDDLKEKKSRTASRTKKAAKVKGAQAKPVKKGSAKYRDPESGKTWSGKGKAPQWIAGAIKDGAKDRFLITASTNGNKATNAAGDATSTRKTRAKTRGGKADTMKQKNRYGPGLFAQKPVPAV